jgi:hypothetical protein
MANGGIVVEEGFTIEIKIKNREPQWVPSLGEKGCGGGGFGWEKRENVS